MRGSLANQPDVRDGLGIIPPLLPIRLGVPPAPRRRPRDPSVGMGWVLYRPSSRPSSCVHRRACPPPPCYVMGPWRIMVRGPVGESRREGPWAKPRKHHKRKGEAKDEERRGIPTTTERAPQQKREATDQEQKGHPHHSRDSTTTTTTTKEKLLLLILRRYCWFQSRR